MQVNFEMSDKVVTEKSVPETIESSQEKSIVEEKKRSCIAPVVVVSILCIIVGLFLALLPCKSGYRNVQIRLVFVDLSLTLVHNQNFVLRN